MNYCIYVVSCVTRGSRVCVPDNVKHSKCLIGNRLSLKWIIFFLFLITGLASASAQAPGAHSGFNGDGELFLGGNYIELGISNWGDFGTEGDAPAGFRGTAGGTLGSGGDMGLQIGMSQDYDGFGVGDDNPIDFYLPGNPEERFAVGYVYGGTQYSNSNCALNSAKNMPTELTNESSGNTLAAKIVSTWTSKMEITQEVSFDVDDSYYRIVVTLKNISDFTMDNVRYMRNVDPDNTQYRGGEHDTRNMLKRTVAEDGETLIMADTSNNNSDPIFTNAGYRMPFFYYSDYPNSRGV